MESPWSRFRPDSCIHASRRSTGEAGGYGCFRIAMYLMPEAANELSWIFLILTGISVVYGAFSACVQTDLKYINAYSSVSHRTEVTLYSDVNQTAATGAILQMLSHGLMYFKSVYASRNASVNNWRYLSVAQGISMDSLAFQKKIHGCAENIRNLPVSSVLQHVRDIHMYQLESKLNQIHCCKEILCNNAYFQQVMSSNQK